METQEPTKKPINRIRTELVTLDESEWERRHRCVDFVTASMVPSILGYNEYESPFTLFHKLRGVSPEPTEDDEFRWAVGHHMEPLLGEFYTKRTGRPVFQPPPCTVAIHPDLPFLLATPDLVAEHGPDASKNMPVLGPGLVECKTTEVWTSDAQDWKDGKPPLRVQCQLQIQLACTGLQWGSLVGMVGLGQFFHVDVERNDDFIDAALGFVQDFKNRLDKNAPPPTDGARSTRETLKQLFPNDDGSVIDLDCNEAARRWHLMRTLKEEVAEREEAIEESKNWFFEHIGDARVGMAGPNKFTLATITKARTFSCYLKNLNGEDLENAIEALNDAADAAGVHGSVSTPDPYRQLYPPKKWK